MARSKTGSCFGEWKTVGVFLKNIFQWGFHDDNETKRHWRERRWRGEGIVKGVGWVLPRLMTHSWKGAEVEINGGGEEYRVGIGGATAGSWGASLHVDNRDESPTKTRRTGLMASLLSQPCENLWLGFTHRHPSRTTGRCLYKSVFSHRSACHMQVINLFETSWSYTRVNPDWWCFLFLKSLSWEALKPWDQRWQTLAGWCCWPGFRWKPAHVVLVSLITKLGGRQAGPTVFQPCLSTRYKCFCRAAWKAT